MKNLVTIALLFLLQSCSMTPAELKTDHPSWTDKQIEVVANGQVYVGMPEDQFRVAWGSPNHEHVITSQLGVTKFLHYYRRIICIRNGYVASISSR